MQTNINKSSEKVTSNWPSDYRARIRITERIPQLHSSSAFTSIRVASLVRGALLRELTHKATCQSCKRFSTFTSHRTIHSRELPPLLAVNTAVHDEETLRPWLDVRRQRFLTPQVELRGDLDGVDDTETALYEIRVS